MNFTSRYNLVVEFKPNCFSQFSFCFNYTSSNYKGIFQTYTNTKLMISSKFRTIQLSITNCRWIVYQQRIQNHVIYFQQRKDKFSPAVSSPLAPKCRFRFAQPMSSLHVSVRFGELASPAKNKLASLIQTFHVLSGLFHDWFDC